MTLLWFSIAALALASFAALGVHSLREFSRPQVRELLRQRNQSARYDEILAHHQQAALGAESLRVAATAAAVLLAAVFVWQSFDEQTTSSQFATVAAIYAVAGIVLLWLAIVWLPLSVGRIWADRLLVFAWPFWQIVGKLAIPSRLGARAVEGAIFRISGQRPKALTEEELEEEIREVVNEGQREGLLEDDAREMIESVITLGEVHVSEIMTPRTDMISLPVDLPWEDALKKVISSGHTRFPVYGKSHDDIVGMLHIKEMLLVLAKDSRASPREISGLMRPPFFVPETKAVDDLLQEFQRGHTHIAVVLDEFGGVSGVVTIEDVLEEIVGEISDEHDDASSDGLEPIDEHRSEALARVHLSEINERMGLNLPDDEHFDTIGGFVFHQLGRIPHAGEEIVHGRVKIKVLDATRRRINRVLIEVLPPEENAEAASSESEEAKGR